MTTEKIETWLLRKSPFISLLYTLPLLLLLFAVYDMAAKTMLIHFHVIERPHPLFIAIIKQTSIENVAMSTFLEELIFRALPIVMTILVITVIFERKTTMRPLLYVVLFVSLVFAVSHGGLLHVFFQGVGSLLIFALFLKYGGYAFYKNSSKFAPLCYGFLAAWLFHFSWNVVAIKFIL
jgi:hypothetical protein